MKVREKGTRKGVAAVVLAMCLEISCSGGGTSSGSMTAMLPPPPALALDLIATVFDVPLGIEQPDDGSSRLFIVEQSGTVRVLENGVIQPTPFLDISGKVHKEIEMGLLGLTFHPDYRGNGRFFLNYTRSNAGQYQSVIAEYQVSVSDSNQADPTSERVLLTVDQVGNFANHKGGQLTFGPDGFLYFALGDGGSGGDPNGNAQNKQSLLGKMMRIDVSGIPDPGLQYRIPPDNPFVGGDGLPEIWAYGFRNPWRFSFDRTTGRLFLADVGQDLYEEVDIVQKGGNYGWNTMEGLHCYQPSVGCDMTGITLPISEYPHPEGDAVVGGFVYRGSAIPALRGTYVYGDAGSGTIWGLQETSPNVWIRTTLATTQRRPIISFGQDQAGELYVSDFRGEVLRVRAQ